MSGSKDATSQSYKMIYFKICFNKDFYLMLLKKLKYGKNLDNENNFIQKREKSTS